MQTTKIMFTIRRCATLLITLTLLPFFLHVDAAWAQSTITVNSTADNEIANDNQCTLREAVNNANSNTDTTNGDCTAGSGTDTIEFNISGTAPFTITLATILPDITNPVIIDGATQPGNSGVCTLAIPDRPAYAVVLDGSSAADAGGTGNSGFRVFDSAGGSTIRGLNIQGFAHYGINLRGSSNNLLECNFIGTTNDGTAAVANTDGIRLDTQDEGGSSNTIRDNLVSGNSGSGILISNNQHLDNEIYGNFVGTDASGTAALPNVQGISDEGTGTIIGLAGKGNLISGNTGNGIVIHENADATIIVGNYIGTDITGTFAVPNEASGILTHGSNGVIGSEDTAGRNIISGNGLAGIDLDISGSRIASGYEVRNNYIGTDVTGTIAVPNGRGIDVSGPDHDIGIRGTTNAGNLISGNIGTGISISGGATTNADVFSNIIGTNAAITAALPNGGHGISIGSQASFRIGFWKNNNDSNVISGNAGDGVNINSVSSTSNSILGNYIGTNPNGTRDLGNGGSGIFLAHNAIDIEIGKTGGGNRTNTIAFNGAGGIVIDHFNSIGNELHHNQIYQNVGLGIDLKNDGFTPNDNGDGDTGANNLQNFPTFSATIDCRGDLILSYSLNSSAAATTEHDVDFYLADIDEEEGQAIVHRTTYQSFPNTVMENLGDPAALGFAAGDVLVATATDRVSNESRSTSEFSPGVAVASCTEHVVTTTADSGPGSLREAIQTANTNISVAIEAITFDIPGVGPHVITPSTALPGLTVPVIVDGTTQPGNETLCTTAIDARSAYEVVLDGGGANFDGLTFGAGSDDSIVQGLNIRDFGHNGIEILGSSDHTIACNFIGTDETGSSAQGNASGVALSTTASTITVGGTATGAGNLISGNTDGLLIQGSDNSVLGNYIGTDRTGAAALGNTTHGVNVNSGAANNTIGGTGAGQGNMIAFNGDDGVAVVGASTTGNVIEGNSFFENVNLGIDLEADGLSETDTNDSDEGGNNIQNPPEISMVDIEDNGDLTVMYEIDTAVGNAAYPLTVAFYVADSDDEEGQTFLGTDTYDTGEAQTTVTATFMPVVPVSTGSIIVATATDTEGNTSEFSFPVSALQDCLLVTNTDDTGFGSLRQAITCANAEPGLDTIRFGLDGPGPHLITPLTELPEITDPVVIDGTTQAGNENLCTTAIEARPAYQVVLDGNGGAFDGLRLVSGSQGSTVQGLNIRNFGGDGLEVNSSQNSFVLCNFVGTDEDGDAAMGNGEKGVRLRDGNNNTVGGTAVGAGNLLSGNTQDGLALRGTVGRNHIVQGNYIGTDRTGTATLGNGQNGIEINGSQDNTIGDTTSGAANRIAFNNGDGVSVTNNSATDNRIVGNVLFENADLGIDLGDNGGTANDTNDADTGPNNLQNTPVISAATTLGTSLSVFYLVDTATSNATYPLQIDFYLPDTDAEEGQTWIGSHSYTAGNAQSSVTATFTPVASVSSGDQIIATATDANGNTSEFSPPVTATNCFIVTNTNDSGPGSLREAITCANTNADLSTITFNIPGAGPHTIAPTTALPELTTPVVIDGASQPGGEAVCTTALADRPAYQIVLDGKSALFDGLSLASGSDGSTIKGLNIQGFGAAPSDLFAALRLEDSAGNTIVCNFIGTDETGTSAKPNFLGIYLVNAPDNTIGGPNPGQGNLVSGHNFSSGTGIVVAGSTGNLIQGNYIGTDKTGTLALGNRDAVTLTGSNSNTTLGGTAPGAGNLISGNSGEGLTIANATSGVVVQGNHIGTDATGTADLGNGNRGILIAGTVTDVMIGGTEAGAGNTIAHNGRSGVLVIGVTGVEMLGNSFFSNGRLGIDLSNNGTTGRTANDADDADTGANNLQNFPVLTDATIIGPEVFVTYEVDTAPAHASYPLRVEFFLADADDEEGQTFLGSDTYEAAEAQTSIGVMLPLSPSGGEMIVATATDADGNTSEFSLPVGVEGAACPTVVTTTGDTGAGTLRQAIACANATAGLQTISFNIAGTGPHVIAPATALPDITDAVVIDGATQPGGEAVCTTAIAARPTYQIVLDGDNNDFSGLHFAAGSDGSTLQGLNIRGFDGVLPLIGGGLFIEGSSGHTIRCNFLGTNEDGTAADGNQHGVHILGGADNLVGGTRLRDGNLIAGHTLQASSSAGVLIEAAGATGNLIQGNTLGTDKTGNQPIENAVGVSLVSASANTIGGSQGGAGNTIAFNGDDGVRIATSGTPATGNEIAGNTVFENGALGIDLEGDGTTANDPADADTGPNNLQNYPDLAKVTISNGGVLEVTYTIDTATGNAAYPLRVEFFLADADDEEGQTFFGALTYSAAEAQTEITQILDPSQGVQDGQWVVATATDADGNTSEFSPSIQARIPGCGSEVTTTADDGEGSLRRVILCANFVSAQGLETITFNIPGPGPHVITPLTALPEITDPLILDASTQPGGEDVCTMDIADRPAYLIILDGAGSTFDGLVLGEDADGSTIKGFNIRNFDGNGLVVDNANDNTVACNFIGTGEDGTTDQGNTGRGVIVRGGASNNTLGGPNPEDGNLISGNNTNGVRIHETGTTGNLIQGNFIGTDASGTAALGNTSHGVFINEASPDNSVVGNVIAGNTTHGIRLNGISTTGNVIQGNFIGTDAGGSAMLGNGQHGISINARSSLIGGTNAGEGNTIAFNTDNGIEVSGNAMVDNAFLGNAIFSNGGLGIDLNNDGLTFNDDNDDDTGENNLQNTPEITEALVLGTGLTVKYSVRTATTNATYPLRIEFFLADSDDEEGQTFLASDTYSTAEAQAQVEPLLTSAVALNAGDQIVATATDADGNTSEFSLPVTATANECLTVTTTANSGAGSLREAITCANNFAGPDTITFNIPGTGPHTIVPATALPEITDPVVIDGVSQPGNEDVCTTAIPDRPEYQIILDGEDKVFPGLRLQSGSGGSTIKGLNVLRFPSVVDGVIDIRSSDNTIVCNFVGTTATGTAQFGSSYGIQVWNGNNNTIGGTDPGDGNLVSGHSGIFNAGIHLFLARGTVIQGNYIGTDKTGTAKLNNWAGVFIDEAHNTTVGGTDPGAGNLISGNHQGILIGQFFGNEGSTGNVVQGNLIGTDATGTVSVNNSIGIVIASGSINNTIGGTAAGAGNTIAFNGDGVRVEDNTSTNNQIVGNAIFENTQLGIDLSNDDVTLNDVGDADTGPNNLQNFPTMTAATVSGTTLSVTYAVDSAPTNAIYPLRVEFFLANGSNRQGQTFLAADTYTQAEAQTSVARTLTSTMLLNDGDQIVATATDADGNTSEFSELQAVTVIDGLTVTVALWLEGPFAGAAMNTNLSDHIPQSDPYSLGQSVATADFFTTDPNGQNVVDWVHLELRTGAPLAPPMTIVAETAALLMSDGSVKATDATSEVVFSGVTSGSYYLVVGHRNHLAVMSPTALDCSSGACLHDFRTGQGQAFGTNALHDLGGGAFGLFAADADASGGITASDQSLWLQQNGTAGYLASDYDLSGGATAPDQVFWLANNGTSGQLPGTSAAASTPAPARLQAAPAVSLQRRLSSKRSQ